MYIQIKVAELVMNLNLVLPGLTGRLVWRCDTLALYLAKVDLITGGICLRQAISYDSVRSTVGPLVRSLEGGLSAL